MTLFFCQLNTLIGRLKVSFGINVTHLITLSKTDFTMSYMVGNIFKVQSASHKNAASLQAGWATSQLQRNKDKVMKLCNQTDGISPKRFTRPYVQNIWKVYTQGRTNNDCGGARAELEKKFTSYVPAKRILTINVLGKKIKRKISARAPPPPRLLVVCPLHVLRRSLAPM